MRRADWLARLYRVVEAGAAVPFAFGSQDCGRFAARCVDAITGSDWERELAGQYVDERTAIRFLARAGGISAAVTERLGPPIAVLEAGRGDVCLLPGEDGPGLGVCLGATVAALRPEGVRYVPLSAALQAWRV